MFLERYAGLVGALIALFMLFMGGVAVYSGVTKWWQLQAETQFIAGMVGEYGQYTQAAQDELTGFLSAKKFESSQLELSISYQPGNPLPGQSVTGQAPAPYGTPITVEMSYPFNAEIFGFNILPQDFNLKTYFSVVSTYVEGSTPNGTSALYSSPVTPTFSPAN